MIDVGGLSLRAAVRGSGPLVLMVHGFPESWYSWRHQLGPIEAAGFTACAIDVRGYGGSDKPHDVADYAMERLIEDLLGVADALSDGAPTILLGHDWGAPIVWNAALTRPDRFSAVGALSVPYLGVGSRPFSAAFDELFTKRGRFFYQAYFQAEGVAEAEAEHDIRRFLRLFYYALSGDAPPTAWQTQKTAGELLLTGLIDPPDFPAWMSAVDLNYYANEFSRSGLRGPLNRYRNYERDWIWSSPYRKRPIEQPALFIAGSCDVALNLIGDKDPLPLMRKHVPNLQVCELLPGCGHWTQQERPADVNALLIPWLRSLFERV